MEKQASIEKRKIILRSCRVFIPLKMKMPLHFQLMADGYWRFLANCEPTEGPDPRNGHGPGGHDPSKSHIRNF